MISQTLKVFLFDGKTSETFVLDDLFLSMNLLCHIIGLVDKFINKKREHILQNEENISILQKRSTPNSVF